MVLSETTPLVILPSIQKKNGGGYDHPSHHPNSQSDSIDTDTSAAAAAAAVMMTSQRTMTTLLGSMQFVLLVFFLFGTTIIDEAYFTSSEYTIFRDIMVMLLLGFGYLMTFLAKYGLSAVGYVFVFRSFVCVFCLCGCFLLRVVTLLSVAVLLLATPQSIVSNLHSPFPIVSYYHTCYIYKFVLSTSQPTIPFFNFAD
jgi:hypothetical protein